MIKEAAKLRSLVDQLITMGPENELNATSFVDTIATECHRVKCAVYEIFKSEPNPEIAAWDVTNFHAGLVKLADQVTERLDAGEKQLIIHAAPPEGDVHPLAFALYCLTDILNFDETCFRGIISNAQVIPQFYILKMKEMLQGKWPGIEEDLQKKKIASWIIREIESGLYSFCARTYPALNYDDYRYFMVFFRELEKLAGNPKNKNWQRRIFFFLLRFNFNHLGLFNHWQDSVRRRIKASAPNGKLEMIDDLEQMLAHCSPLNDHAYNHDLKELSLKQHMLVFLHHQKQKAIREIPAEQIKLKTTMNVNTHALEFHYKYKQRIYNYDTKIEAATSYAAVHESKGRTDFSIDSLLHLDRNKLKNEAVEFHKMLKGMDDDLREDFDL